MKGIMKLNKRQMLNQAHQMKNPDMNNYNNYNQTPEKKKEPEEKPAYDPYQVKSYGAPTTKLKETLDAQGDEDYLPKTDNSFAFGQEDQHYSPKSQNLSSSGKKKKKKKGKKKNKNNQSQNMSGFASSHNDSQIPSMQNSQGFQNNFNTVANPNMQKMNKPVDNYDFGGMKAHPPPQINVSNF